MVLYLLNQGEEVRLPARPLLVRLQGVRAVAGRLVAAGSTSGPLAEPQAFARAGGLLLPRVKEAVTVTILPVGGSALFPAQTLITVLLGPDGGDPDVDHVQLALDVSGLPSADLVVLEPVGGQIRVTARGPRLEPPLPPTAELSRDVAREMLGLAYVSGADAVDLVVGVDCSPSMRPWVHSGALEATLEVFAGLASVIDPNGRVDAVLCGRTATTLPPEATDVFASSVMTELGKLPLVTGLRSRALPAHSETSLAYLVTDAVPADFDPQAQLHLAVLMEGSSGAHSLRRGRGGLTPIQVELGPTGMGRWTRAQVLPVVASLLTAFEQRAEGSG